MATWGVGPFENDTALNYLEELRELEEEELEARLAGSIEGTDNTDESWQEAVCAAAVLACREDENLAMDSPAATWLATEPVPENPDLQELAATTLQKAVRKSPLQERWKQRGELEDAQTEHQPYINALT